MQKSYSDLYDYFSDVEEYKKQISISQDLWSNSANKNCDVSAYFVEEGIMVYDITFSECMTEEYKYRDKFLTHLRSVVEQIYQKVIRYYIDPSYDGYFDNNLFLSIKKGKLNLVCYWYAVIRFLMKLYKTNYLYLLKYTVFRVSVGLALGSVDFFTSMLVSV